MPKYRFAVNPQNKIVDVLEMSKGEPASLGPFHCAGCGAVVIPKLKDDLRVKHFAHKVQQANCNEETYLHRLAKRIFVEVYQECLENEERFEIELRHPQTCSRFKEVLGVRCRVGDKTKKYNLTDLYDGIREEQRDGQFIPDVLLFNSAEPTQKIYIEIAVTHFLSEAKEASGQKIIEIPIEMEADIEKIRVRLLTENEAKFVGFDRSVSLITDAQCQCAQRAFFVFFVYDDGKCFLERAPLTQIVTKRQSLGSKVRFVRLLSVSQTRQCMRGQSSYSSGNRVLENEEEKQFEIDENDWNLAHPAPRVNENEGGSLFIKLVKQAQEQGVPVKNCFACRYSGVNWDWNASGVYCKYLKHSCNSNAAVSCAAFRPPKPASAASPGSSSELPVGLATRRTEVVHQTLVERVQPQSIGIKHWLKDTEERIAQLGQKREEMRVRELLEGKHKSDELPDGCLYKTELVELWQEPDGFVVYTRAGAVKQTTNAHDAFTYLAECGMFDTDK